MSGHEVLIEFTIDPDLRRIPVVVLTTSRDHDDVTRSYDLHASVHVSKPIDFDASPTWCAGSGFFGNVTELEGR